PSPMLHLKSCHCCGLIQSVPVVEREAGVRYACSRCETALASWLKGWGGNQLSGAVSLAAICVYLPAMLLPFLRIGRLGLARESSRIGGVQTLFTEGHLLVGSVVLLFSVVLPVVKLSALLLLAQSRWRLSHRHRAATYRMVEHLGRWGMLDVLLVAVMIAFVKLGGLVTFSAGPGLLAFVAFVLLSLCAGAMFDPFCLWDDGVA